MINERGSTRRPPKKVARQTLGSVVANAAITGTTDFNQGRSCKSSGAAEWDN